MLVLDGVLVVSVWVELVWVGSLFTVVQDINRSELTKIAGINRKSVFIV